MTPYEQGYDACPSLALIDNPYVRYSTEWEQWRAGWNQRWFENLPMPTSAPDATPRETEQWIFNVSDQIVWLVRGYADNITQQHHKAVGKVVDVLASAAAAERSRVRKELFAELESIIVVGGHHCLVCGDDLHPNLGDKEVAHRADCKWRLAKEGL